LLIHVLSDVILNVIIDQRANFVEDILPDALLLIAANIRSGMTIDQALISSAREEFKHFEKEIERASKEALSGASLEQALRRMTERIDSSILKRSLDLISEGVSSGGEMTSLLENIAEDIRSTKILKKQIRTNVLTYTTLILIAVCVGAPLLFSVSTFLVGVVSRFSAVSIPEEALYEISTLRVMTPNVDLTFLVIVSLFSLSVNAFFAALVIGLLEKGKITRGVTLVIPLILISIIMFFVTRVFVSNVFSGLVG
jgi:type II secretory pathway component PulF